MLMTRLPEEIQVDVFLRLPVKSIQSCRCVCKPLCRLLYNSKFIKYHLLNHNKKNPRLMFISILRFPNLYPITCRSIDAASILSASSSAHASTVTCDGAIPMNNDFFQLDWDPQNCIHVVGACNCLICLRISNADSRFCVWNPSTGECKKFSCFHFTSVEIAMYGFGYDSDLDDYKLLKIVLLWENSIRYFRYSQVEVYTFGSNSIETIQCMKEYLVVPPNHFSVWLLNGALHWPGFINGTSSRVIVSYDISCKTFLDFLYPEEIIDLHRIGNPYDLVGLLEDRLCLIIYGGRHFPIDVWVMQDYGVRESWTKQFSFKQTFPIYYCNFKLAWSSTNGMALIDVGEKKFIYDPKNDSTKDFEIRGFDRMAWSQPVSYVESLASLNKSGPTFGWVKECK